MSAKVINLTLDSGPPVKSVKLTNFRIGGQNKISLLILLVELKIPLEYTIDVGDLKTFLKENVGLTWRDWAKPWLLNLYDSYAWSQQIKNALDGEAI